jgi:hypothetical protein
MNVATEVQAEYGRESSHLNVGKEIIRATAYLIIWIAAAPFIIPGIMSASVFVMSLMLGSPVKDTAEQAIIFYPHLVSIFLHLIASLLHTAYSMSR